MKELLEKVLESESSKEIWRNDYNSEQWRNANKLNRHLFGINLNQSKGCQCIEDLFFMIKRESVKNRIMNQFKIKKGSVITSFVHATVTEHSTDAEIIAMLKASPASIKYVVEYPENWKEIVNGKPTISRDEMKAFLTEKCIEFPNNIKTDKLTDLYNAHQEEENGESKDHSGQGQD